MTKLAGFGRVVLAICVGLAGCAPMAGPLAAADGTYRGTSTRFQALRRDCPRPRVYPQIPVRSGVLFFPWGGQFVQSTVYSNGTVSAASAGVQVTGTYDGTIIRAKLTDGQCGLDYMLKREGG